MYYEEKVIDGRLMYRIDPKGEWAPVKGAKAIAVSTLSLLTDDERKEVLSFFCACCNK
ncbi:MAG: hypothetical protein GF364_09570 [Candidatus Lokiarchaeota archaeon]|nr:hypothetical protein [Candidatus Lokiarchaeota archaeon]